MNNLEICDDLACVYFDPIVSAIVVGLLVWLVTWLINYMNARKAFGKIEGSYAGFGFETNGISLKSNQHSKAEVKYLKRNLCEISVTEYPNQNKYNWEGIITLDSENYGTITWRYTIFNGKKTSDNIHKFGLKRIIIHSDKKECYLYLVEDNIDNENIYPKEVFKKI